VGVAGFGCPMKLSKPPPVAVVGFFVLTIVFTLNFSGN
jgi:hypothetical protein